MELVGADGLEVDVYFQRDEGLRWAPTQPRPWAGVATVPDVVIVARSDELPVVVVDGHGANRGPTDDGGDDMRVGPHATYEETHRMLGFFSHFARPGLVGPNGPVGAMLYPSTTPAPEVWTAHSDTHGLLCSLAIDPTDEHLDDRLADLVARLLSAAHLTAVPA
jgi:hypothetical protein